MSNPLENKSLVEDVLFRGKKLSDNAIRNISTVDIEMSIDQVSELSFTFDDPDFKLLRTGAFDLKTPVSFRGLKLSIAVIETNAGGGLGGFGIRCRPEIVRKLKKLRGAFVMQNASPADYVAAEIKKVGGPNPFTQQSPKKSRISRDVPQKGQDYDNTNHPSAWTTFQRLATELGYVMYEIGGVIHFGKPTFLVKQKPKTEVKWYPENGTEPYTFPEFRQSIDDEDVEVSMELDIRRAGKVFPGSGLRLTGYPKFSGTYLINNVSYPLVGVGNMSITASTVKNPDPQKGQEEDTEGNT